MKNTMKILFLIVFLFTAKNFFAESKVDIKEVKSTLTKLFDLCKNKNYKDASLYLAYTGKDGIKRFNYSEKSDKKIVKRKCKKIKAYLELSDAYEYGKFSSVGNKGNIEIIFKSGDQEFNIVFSFIKLGTKILLLNFK